MKSILIAEGDRHVASLFAMVFSRSDWKVASSGDAHRAIEAIRGTEHFDVVLVSYNVPGTNGVELTRLVRSLEHRKDTPVVMVTGRTGIEVEALRAGASEVLSKPVDISKLVAAVSKYVSGPGYRK